MLSELAELSTKDLLSDGSAALTGFVRAVPHDIRDLMTSTSYAAPGHIVETHLEQAMAVPGEMHT